jgi:hypothetical protein
MSEAEIKGAAIREVAAREAVKEKDWQHFHTFKQRGEWVELQFMAHAALHRYSVSKPWGDCSAYDVGVEHGSDFLRVQVKSTTVRTGTGYFCQFKPNYQQAARLHARRDRSLRRLRDSGERLVSDSGRRDPETKTQGRTDAPSRRQAQKESLPLRALPRSLAPARQNPRGAVEYAAAKEPMNPMHCLQF